MQDFSLYVITSIVIFLGIFKFYFEKKIIHSIVSKTQLINKQREVFSEFLDLWSERVTGNAIKSGDWIERFAKASKDVLLWCPDPVLRQIALFVQTFKHKGSEEQEIHFAKALLNFRKTLGYKNYWGKITPEDVVKIFNAGQPNYTKNKPAD